MKAKINPSSCQFSYNYILCLPWKKNFCTLISFPCFVTFLFVLLIDVPNIYFLHLFVLCLFSCDFCKMQFAEHYWPLFMHCFSHMNVWTDVKHIQMSVPESILHSASLLCVITPCLSGRNAKTERVCLRQEDIFDLSVCQ